MEPLRSSEDPLTVSDTENIEKLFRLTIELGTSLDERREIRGFIDWLRNEIRPKFAALYVADDRKFRLEPVGSVGVRRTTLPEIPMGEDVWRYLEDVHASVRVGAERRYSVPLVLEGQLLGFLAVVSSNEGGILRAEKKVLAAAAACLAPVLRNIWRYRSLEDQVRQRTADLVSSERKYRELARRLNFLREVDRRTLEGKSVAEIAESVVRRIPELIPGTEGVVIRVDLHARQGEVLSNARWRGASIHRGLRMSLDSVPDLVQKLEKGEPLLIAEVPEPVRGKTEWDLVRIIVAQRPQWALFWPILVEGDTFGALVLVGLDGKEWNEAWGEIVQDLCDSLAVAARQEQLRQEIESYQQDLERKVRERTAELQKLVNLMAGREIRMAELKDVIRLLRKQLLDAGLTPVVNDPLADDEDAVEK